MKRFLYPVLAALLFTIAFASFASAQTIRKIVFFGDSLSDSGNNFIFTGQSTAKPYPIGPAAFSYNIGGHHFSNGATWAEQLSTMLHIPNSGHPSLRTPGVFTDYAVGDARSRAGAPTFPYFDLTTQVGDFLTDFGGKAPADALFVIWIGADDLEDALNALTADPSGATSLVILEDAIAAIEANIGRLYAAGGRMFLIANVPDLANTPYVQYLGANVDPAIPVIASEFTLGFDVELVAATGGLAGLPGMQYFRFFDVNALFSEVLAAPGKFKLINVTDRCTIPNVTGRAMCTDPGVYLFWDGTHPTTAAHGIVAAAALSILPPQ